MRRRVGLSVRNCAGGEEPLVAADDIGRDRQARDEALRTGFRFLLGKASRAAFKRESREPEAAGGWGGGGGA